MSQDAQLFSLPFLKPWWRKAKQVLLRLFEANTVDRLRRRLHILSQCGIPHLNRDPFGNLCTYLEDSIPLADQIHFLEKVFPTILYLVLNLEEHPEEWSALTCLMRNRGSEVIVRRLTIASLLSTSFLCLLPQQSLWHQEIPYNFEPLYLNLHTETAREKLKCFINYFDVLSQQIPNNSYLGAVKITRRVLPGWCALRTDLLEDSNRNLSSFKVCRNSKLEEFPNDVLKIGQISRVLGHHVWEPNCTPEDVLVCRSPEILGCSFLCEALADSEALEFSGCSAFSQTKGVSSSFEFVAPVTRQTNMNYSHLCAIDAINFQGIPIESQFTEECVLREINKCYIGLLPQSKLPQRKVKLNALARYASKLSSSIFKEAKFQAQTLQFRQKSLNRRKVAEDFADTIMDTLVKDLPVVLKQRVPIGSGSSHNTSPKDGGSYLNYLEGVTLTLTPPDDEKSKSLTVDAENSNERDVSLKALEEFSDLFVSNLLRLVTDQLFPRATSRKSISKHRRRGSSRSNSLTQSFSLYDIVYSEGDATGILKPTAVGFRDEQNSNFFLGDIEETSADFVTDTSDWSSRGSGKYKSKLPLSSTLAAETFFRGRKFASIREQFSNVLATQILAEAIASYINTLAKKNSSTESSSSPRLESSLSDETRRGSNISSVEEYAYFLSDKIVFDAYQTICGRLAPKGSVDTRYSAMEDDLYSLHSQQTNYSRSRRGSGTRRSVSRRRSSNVSVVSSHTINERLYSFFVITLFFKVWSLFILMVTQSFSSHYKRSHREDSAATTSAIPIDASGDKNNSKRNSIDSCHGLLEHDFDGRLRSVTLEQSGAGSNEDNAKHLQKCQNPLIIDTKSFNSTFSSTAGSVANELLEDGRRDLTTVSTQTFGCTSFGGDSQFKLFILWIAASMAGVDSVLFHPYGDSKLLEVEKMIHLVVSNGLTVADLFSLLLKYCNYIDLFKSYDSNTEPKPFFTFVENLYN